MTKNERVEKLIGRLAIGGTDALEELYRLIKTDVYAFALSKTGNPADAEDIMQDTFVQIYKYAARYEAKGKPMAWVFTIVTNFALRKFQLNKRYAEYDDTVEEIPSERQFDAEIANNEFLRQLMQILKPEEQEIIVLHIVSGLKHHEIAKILEAPLSTVLSRYNRAMKKLQKAAKEHDW